MKKEREMRKVIGLMVLSALILGFSGCSDTGKVAEESEIGRMVKEEFAKDAAKKNNPNAREIAKLDWLIQSTKENIKSVEEDITKAKTESGKEMMRKSIEGYKDNIRIWEERKKELQ
jgi:peptidoglycan hydrolase CwlO-like protein